MIRHYLILALRTLRRNTIVSTLNLIGLSLAIASCILIYLFVSNELAYDRHFPQPERIFRVNTVLRLSEKEDNMNLSSFLLSPTLSALSPEVEQASRVMPLFRQTIWKDGEAYYIPTAAFVDSNYFAIFPEEFLAGDPQTALAGPQKIVISDEQALRLFGTVEGALGQLLKFTRNSYTVTGVYRLQRDRSHLEFDAFLSIASMSPGYRENLSRDWFWMAQMNYIKLKKEADTAAVQKALNQIIGQTVIPWARSVGSTATARYYLQELTSIRLSPSHISIAFLKVQDPKYLLIFSLAALIILAIACINYTNLSTATAIARGKEVGIRKTAGATATQIATQFLSETLLMSVLAVLIALALVELALPLFNSVTDKHFTLGQFLTGRNIGVLVVFTGLTALLAGFWPAVLLSRFDPAYVLKSGNTPKGPGARVRKGLVIAQFALSVGLLICTTVIFSQMYYLKNKDLGFDKERIYVIETPLGDSSFVARHEEVKSALRTVPGVEDVGYTDQLPGAVGAKIIHDVRYGGKRVEGVYSLITLSHNAMAMLGIKLVEGRPFSLDIRTDDTAAFVVNQSFLAQVGAPKREDIEMGNGMGYNGKPIGTASDFNFESLHNPIEPLVIVPTRRILRNTLVKVAPGTDPEALQSQLAQVWKQFSRRYPMESYWLGDKLAESYQNEERTFLIFTWFSTLTLVIACLGLYGLSWYSTQQRTKEIGIRKILGASVWSITWLVSFDFLRLVGLSLVLAIPVAAWYMQAWLQTFAFRVDLGVWMFASAAVLAVVLAFLTTSLQASKAARRNPAESLRYE